MPVTSHEVSGLKAKPSRGLEPRAYRINDACEIIGISRSTLYALIARGEVRLNKVAGRSLILKSEVDRLLPEGKEGAR
jgi:excisionase family DNA binding protein